MNFSFFPIEIESCEEGGFFAKCPLFQGCHAEGETYGQTIDNILDAIKNHKEIREERGEIVSNISVQEPTNIHLNIPVPLVT